MYEIYTLEEVVNEIRDERARLFLESTPYEMETLTGSSFVDQKDLNLVDNFARETGDLGTLSRVDKLVIAAGLTISRQKGEFKNVLLNPAKLEEFKPSSFKAFYEEDDDDFWNEDEDSTKKQAPVADVDEWNDAVKPSKNAKKDSKAKNNDLFAKYQQKAEEARKAMAGSDDEGDNAKVENKPEAATAENS
jgi:hypothetical protein